jgi:hypothetical protein
MSERNSKNKRKIMENNSNINNNVKSLMNTNTNISKKRYNKYNKIK